MVSTPEVVSVITVRPVVIMVPFDETVVVGWADGVGALDKTLDEITDETEAEDEAVNGQYVV